MPAIQRTRGSERDLIQLRRAVQSLDHYLSQSGYKLRFTPGIKTDDYTALLTDDFLVFDTSDNAITLSLPQGSTTEGAPYVIKLAEAGNDLTIDPYGSEEIEGELTAIMDTTGEAIWITFDSTYGWMVH